MTRHAISWWTYLYSVVYFCICQCLYQLCTVLKMDIICKTRSLNQHGNPTQYWRKGISSKIQPVFFAWPLKVSRHSKQLGMMGRSRFSLRERKQDGLSSLEEEEELAEIQWTAIIENKHSHAVGDHHLRRNDVEVKNPMYMYGGLDHT